MMRKSLVGTAVAFAVCMAHGEVIHVPGDQPTIQGAIVAAMSGDVIEIAAGVYHQSFVLSGKAVTLRGADGASATFIDGTGLGNVNLGIIQGAATSGSVVEGLTFRNGELSAGSGTLRITNGSAPIVRHCVFESNSGNNGPGIHLNCVSPVIVNCVFRENAGNNGGGIGMFDSTPMIANCLFVENSVVLSGGAIRSHDGSMPTLVNCTIVGNSANTGGAIYIDGISGATISNSIVWGNGANAIMVSAGGVVTVERSLVEGGWSGVGNIDADPGFFDAPGGDYRPMAGSPGSDAGDNTLLPSDLADVDGDGDVGEALPIDLDGVVRAIDDVLADDVGVGGAGFAGIVDMGAYEAVDERLVVGDLDGDGDVDTADLLILLGSWGPCPACVADLDGDDVVGVTDLLILLAAWG